jgi:Tol biopolymer transport system component
MSYDPYGSTGMTENANMNSFRCPQATKVQHLPAVDIESGSLAMKETQIFRHFRGGLLLLATFLSMTGCHRTPSARIESVAISPNGRSLAIDVRDNISSFIYKVDVASGDATRLTDAKTGNESSPSFSPDGKRIAYSYSPGKGQPSRIITQNLDGSQLHTWPVSTEGGYLPAFSPDGKTIIFARFAYFGNYSPIAQPHPHGWDLYAADSDGEKVRQLTHEGFYNASPPSVSPDGKRMVVVRETADKPPEIVIYSLDHPEKPERSLQPHVPGEPKLAPVFESPNFMPDGKSLLFMAASNGKHGYDYDVYKIDIASGSVEKLTQGNGFATDLKVSADGKTAAFLKWRLNWQSTPVQSTPYLLNVQTHELTPLRITVFQNRLHL